MSSIRPLSSAPSARRIVRARTPINSSRRVESDEPPLRTRAYGWRATLSGGDAGSSETARLVLSVEEDSDAAPGALLFDVAGTAFHFVGSSDAGAGSRLSFETSREALEAMRDGLTDILARHTAR